MLGFLTLSSFCMKKTLSRYVGLTNGGALLLYDAAWTI